MKELFEYQALTDFYSQTLNKRIKTGQKIKAPAALGSQWIKAGHAKKLQPKIKKS